MASLNQDAPFAQETLSLPHRLALALVDPRRSFESVIYRESAYDWLVPVVLACAVGIVAHFLTVDLVTNVDAPQVQQALQGMDDAHREQYLRGIEIMRTRGWMMVPVGVFSSLVLIAGVLMMTARSLFSAELTFRQALVVKAFGGLTFIPEWIVRTPLVLITGDPNFHTGPGLFVKPESVDSLLGRLMDGVNFFDLWQLWILALGLSVFSGISARKSGVALTVLWLMWVVGGALLEGMRAAMPPAPPVG